MKKAQEVIVKNYSKYAKVTILPALSVTINTASGTSASESPMTIIVEDVTDTSDGKAND